MKNLLPLLLLLLVGLPTLSAQYNISSTASSATATILDDDLAFSISDAAAQEEGNEASDGVEFTFTVTRTGDEASTASVDWALKFGTGSGQADSDDFTGGGGTLNFAANETSKEIRVMVAEDQMTEEDEAFEVELTNATTGSTTGMATITDAIGASTIINDDTTVSIAVGNPNELAEGTAGTFTYTFTRVGALSNPLSVSFSATGTATAGTDYELTGANTFDNGSGNGTVVFPANDDTVSVTVTISDDALVEDDETVILTITGGN